MSAKIVGELTDWNAFVGAAPTNEIEVDPLGLSYDIETAVAQSGSFRQIGHRIDGDLIRVEMEWCKADLPDAEIDRDFYQLYGEFAEDLQFVQRRVEADAVVYHVVSGSMYGRAGHVHFAKFHVTGPGVRRIIERHSEVKP